MFGLTDKVAALVFAGVSAILLALCAVLYIEANGLFWIDGLKDKLEDCERDRNELRAGVAEAKRLNDEQVKRIESEQEQINDDIERKYEADRARLKRELADSLRAKASPRNPGSPQASPDGKAPGGIDEEAKVCIPTGDYVSGAETELQLDTLITWVEQQLKVER